MAIEEIIRNRITQLIDEGKRLSAGVAEGERYHECSAWLSSAQNAIHLVCDSPNAPYRIKADQIAARGGFGMSGFVGELAAVLRNLLADAEAGLLASVADQARAETFDNFLDHSEAYLVEGRKNEAGVIAGVVFEDTMRRICRREGIDEMGAKLDGLISELNSRGELSAMKAKRARVAAHVRTKASHAQWDEFEIEDVKATIEFTRELIASKLDS